MKKTYVFWAKKAEDNILTWTVFKAAHINEVRQWAKSNGITIDGRIKIQR